MVSGHEHDVVFLDFTKAFDKVAHEILIRKLQLFGIEGKLLSWIEPFLLYKKQLVTVNGVYSLFTLILSGVTQGSVLARFSSSFTFTIFKIC